MNNPPTDRTAEFYGSLVAFQNTHRLPGLQHAQIRGLLAEHLARAFPAVPPTTTDRDRIAAPTVWIDGHPQLEAIAAAVWESCRTEESSTVVDDPRNIAVAALGAVLPPNADRAVELAKQIELRDYWHAEAMSATTRIIELEGQLEELRRVAAEASQRQSLADTEESAMWDAVDRATPGHIFKYEYQRIVRAAFDAIGIGIGVEAGGPPAPRTASLCPGYRTKGHSVCIGSESASKTVHAVPLPGSNGISACCGRPPCEFVGERVTRDPGAVTCPGPAASAGVQTDEETSHG